MPGLNRNIITSGDIRQAAVAGNAAQVPRTLELQPPGGVVPLAQPAGGNAQNPGDGYLTKLLKYVPLEVVGTYLFMTTLVHDRVTDPSDLKTWLGTLGLVALVATALYDVKVLNIVRTRQVVMSVLGIGVYIFASGDWFATTTWYQAWYASIALAAYAFIVGAVKIPELPLGPG